MAVAYTVVADVIDIGTDVPRAGDAFVVDTNVWYWMTYSNASHGDPPWRAPIRSAYANYVNAAKAKGADLRWVGLSLSELAYNIEKTEFSIYGATAGAAAPSKQKEYRHNLNAERAKVVAEVRSAWTQVESIGGPVDLMVDQPTTTSALGRLAAQMLDGYDLFITEVMAAAGIDKIITDDGDYCSVPGIIVFTANRSVIQAAAAQGKLVVR